MLYLSMISELSLSLVLGSAIVDSINPCAFAVLIFLILYLFKIKSKRKMMQIGLLYIGIVFLVYFVSGLGLLSFIQNFQITRFFYIFTAGLAIILGLVNVKEAFWAGKGVTLAIPDSKKPLIQKYIRKATFPATIVLGVLVAIFELPCTGGVYLAILSLLADQVQFKSAVLYLLLYNFIFVLPLLIILFAVYFGLSPEKVETWRKEKRAWMRLSIGIVMIALGVIMLIM